MARPGEEEIRRLFDRYYHSLCLYARGILGDLEASRDLVQEVFVTVWERNVRSGSEAEKRNFLYTCVRNAAINQLDKNRRIRSRQGELKHYYEVMESEEERYPGESRENILYEAIEKLPEKTREVFRLVHIQGMKYQEAADHLNLSKNTVKTQLARSIRLLREALSGNGIRIILILLSPFLGMILLLSVKGL